MVIAGVPVTSMREIRVLQTCRHPNIVHLKKVVTGSKADSIFLVFEYCSHDLGRLIDMMPRPFSSSEVKCLMLQVKMLPSPNFEACLVLLLNGRIELQLWMHSFWRQWISCTPTGSCRET